MPSWKKTFGYVLRWIIYFTAHHGKSPLPLRADVYKRQVHTSSGGNAYRHYMLTDSDGISHQVYCVESGIPYHTSENTYVSESGTNSQYLNPVSYTHLDVYKRQSLYRRNFPICHRKHRCPCWNRARLMQPLWMFFRIALRYRMLPEQSPRHRKTGEAISGRRLPGVLL